MIVLQRLAKAFFLGGCLSILTQIIYMLYTAFLPFTDFALVLLSLFTMGVIGAILYVMDIYPKLEKMFGFGAMLPISGLSAAVAAGITHSLKEGLCWKQALKSGVIPVALVLIVGFVFSALLALVIWFCIGG